jgi:hypothetical protein
MASHIYDIINNSEYRIGSPFPFIECYEWLSKNSSVLDCGPSAITEDDAPVCQDIEEAFTDVVVADDVAAEVEIESGTRTSGKRLRPLGTEAAKKGRTSAPADIIGIEASVSEVALPSSKFSAVYEKAQAEKLRSEKRKLRLAKDRLKFEKIQVLLSSGYSLTESERRKLEQSLLASIENEEEPKSRAQHIPVDIYPESGGNVNGNSDDKKNFDHQVGDDDDDVVDDAPIQLIICLKNLSLAQLQYHCNLKISRTAFSQ